MAGIAAVIKCGCDGRRIKRRTLNPQHIYWSAQTTGNGYKHLISIFKLLLYVLTRQKRQLKELI